MGCTSAIESILKYHLETFDERNLDDHGRLRGQRFVYSFIDRVPAVFEHGGLVGYEEG